MTEKWEPRADGSPSIEPTEADYDDMHHALGRPKRADADTYRNYYCVPVGTDTERRFNALGWWDFSHTINDGRSAIYSVNGAGKAALDKWINTPALQTTEQPR